LASPAATCNNNWALLSYYAASSDNSLPMFWDNLSVPSSRVKNPRSILNPSSPERHSTVLIYFEAETSNPTGIQF